MPRPLRLTKPFIIESPFLDRAKRYIDKINRLRAEKFEKLLAKFRHERECWQDSVHEELVPKSWPSVLRPQVMEHKKRIPLAY